MVNVLEHRRRRTGGGLDGVLFTSLKPPLGQPAVMGQPAGGASDVARGSGVIHLDKVETQPPLENLSDVSCVTERTCPFCCASAGNRLI